MPRSNSVAVDPAGIGAALMTEETLCREWRKRLSSRAAMSGALLEGSTYVRAVATKAAVSFMVIKIQFGVVG